MLRKSLFILLASVLFLSCKASGVKETVSINSLQITTPLTLKEVLKMKDGGTVGVKMSDSNGNNFSFCIDGRVEVKPPRKIFFGAIHPSEEGAKELAISGQDEKNLLKILKIWRAENSNEKARNLAEIDRIIKTLEKR